MEKADRTRSRTVFVLAFAAAALTAGVIWLHPRPSTPPAADTAQSEPKPVAADPGAFSPPASATSDQPARPAHPSQPLVATLPDKPAPSTNKLERLQQIRESFRVLAAGDPTNALRSAKQITDATERETALLTLVTEWKHGDLSPPVQRAGYISEHGLEAGLGIELAKSDPALAMFWADELTDPAGRAAVLEQAAQTTLKTDPSAAFAIGAQLPEADQAKFSQALFAAWAADDTEAAIQWADQLSDPADHDAAMQAIQSTAPVGIGTAIRMQDGYPVINGLIPGAAADTSGQLHVGDRIVALAQGDGQFVNVQNVSLQDVVAAIRGQPNTILQLQVIPAGADPNSLPTTISIIRDQIKFKH